MKIIVIHYDIYYTNTNTFFITLKSYLKINLSKYFLVIKTIIISIEILLKNIFIILAFDQQLYQIEYNYILIINSTYITTYINMCLY